MICIRDNYERHLSKQHLVVQINTRFTTYTYIQPYINPQMYREHKIPPKLAYRKTTCKHTQKNTSKLTYTRTNTSKLTYTRTNTHKLTYTRTNTHKLTHQNASKVIHIKTPKLTYVKTRPDSLIYKHVPTHKNSLKETPVQTHTRKNKSKLTQKNASKHTRPNSHTEKHVVSTAHVAQPMWETVLWQAICGCKDRKASMLAVLWRVITHTA